MWACFAYKVSIDIPKYEDSSSFPSLKFDIAGGFGSLISLRSHMCRATQIKMLLHVN